jgi:hypothetical protein
LGYGRASLGDKVLSFIAVLRGRAVSGTLDDNGVFVLRSC